MSETSGQARKVAYEKLHIAPDFETQGWWDGARRGQYLVRQCRDCAQLWFPPGPMCKRCNSANTGWYATPGTGVLYSCKVIPRAVLPAFEGVVPYVVALIEMDGCSDHGNDPVRVVGLIVNPEREVSIGALVQVSFQATDDGEFVVPEWHISGNGKEGWRFDE